jgi:hypothetical protein
MKKVVLYSCVTNKYDIVENTILASIGCNEEEIKFVLFTDSPLKGDTPKKVTSSGAAITWELRPLVWKHPLCKRRTARYHKVNSHVLNLDADYTIWIDGSQQIKPVPLVKQLVNPLINKYMLASFKHPERTCIYQEMQACRKLRKDNPQLMANQINAYRKEGYPPYNGLVETACVLRKQCDQITEFNKLWWSQIENHSFRDQLSFNYVAWKLKQEYGKIPGSRMKSTFFDFISHGKKSA